MVIRQFQGLSQIELDGPLWIILDVISEIVPVIIDAATGAWYELDQKNINAILEVKK